ncbi:MAG: hypothetical protein IKF90_21390 [Parasporobacterium sp.]|nr:hypothetical protein [Parasporobacterium sp.]
MDINNVLIRKKRRLAAEEKKYSDVIQSLPDGRLEVGKNGDYYKYYSVKDGKRVYLPKSESERIECLAKKRYLQELRKDVQAEIKAIDYYLKYHQSDSSAKKLLASQNGVSAILKDLLVPEDETLRKWTSEEYQAYQGFPQMLVHRGPFGKMFRSKTEADIAYLLTKHRIPYRYEWEHLINGIYYPIDFTTRHPKTGQYVFWEHFGQMDKPSYVAKIGTKLLDFESAGIFPEVNLILTFESTRFPMNVNQLEETVEKWYLD